MPAHIGEVRITNSRMSRFTSSGASFIVTSRDEEVAIILPPPPPARSRRQPGTMRGNNPHDGRLRYAVGGDSGCHGGQLGLRLLLDTHALLWWLADDVRLGPFVRDLIADPANDVLVSVVSLWEIQAMVRAGKLSADVDRC